MSMFDPYHKWLGIPKGSRPPTHYQLLGISPDEIDPEVIQASAVRQSAYVRHFQTGPHARDCDRVLKDLAVARDTLLDARRRSTYDARVQTSFEAANSPAEEAGLASPRGATLSVSPLVSIVTTGLDGSTGGPGRQSQVPRPTAIGSVSLAALIALAIAVFVVTPMWSLSRTRWLRLRSHGEAQEKRNGPESAGTRPPKRPTDIAPFDGGVASIGKGDSQRSIAEASSAEKTPPERPTDVAPFDGGVALIAKQDFAGAIAEFSSALRADPKSAESYHQRGWCHRQEKDFDRAIADFSKAIELGRASSYADRGDAYFHKGDDEKALIDVDKAIQIDPKNHWAFWVKSRVMARRGDHRAEIASLDRANEIAPKSEYWVARGQAFERLNEDRRQAIGSYSRAIRLDPDSVAAYGHRAWQFSMQKLYVPAEMDYMIGLTIEPRNHWLLVGRGINLIHAGSFHEALKSLDRAIEVQPNNAAGFIHRSWAYRKMGDAVRADADRRKALELDPSSARQDANYR
jgi:tetratricopeptide (TPR) repeat protein